MKSAKEWAKEIREALGNGLRYDPALVDGKSLLEHLVETIQVDASTKSARPAHSACPCLHTTPCHPACTCVHSHSSVGCARCCSYGSKEQQQRKAEWLAKKIDA